MTILDLLNENEKSNTIYKTEIDFIDSVLDGGFEGGQLITITGEQEAGKTQLVNQILCNVAKKHKCLYFSLEFNKKQIKKYFRKKLQNKTVSKKALSNIIVITNDMIDSEISNITKKIDECIKSHNISFVAIDSTLTIYEKNLTGEQEITEIFRQLHNITLKNDVVMLAISQASKQDNKDNRVSIFGSQKANHFANIMIHIAFNRENNEREIIFAKNKQNGIHKRVKINFDRELLMFYQNIIKQQIDIKKIDKNESDIIILDDIEEETEEEIKKIDNLKEKGFLFDE